MLILEGTTPLEDLLSAAGTVITSITTTMGTVATTLLGNAIFQVMFGLLILFVVLGIIFRLVYHARKGR